MNGRQAVSLLLAALMVVPAWAATPEGVVIGNVASSQAATLRGSALTPGSTILSGDTIQVNAKGTAWIAVTGGSQIQLAENSEMRLGKSQERVEFELGRGRVLFRSVAEAPIVGRVADATIQSIGGPAAGVIELRGANMAFIAATKGALEIRTAHDNYSIILHEREGVTVPVAQDPAPQQNKSRKKRGAAAWGTGQVLLLAGGLAAVVITTALILGHKETKQPQPCNAVSPFTCF
jgi:hypothetical protein